MLPTLTFGQQFLLFGLLGSCMNPTVRTPLFGEITVISKKSGSWAWLFEAMTSKRRHVLGTPRTCAIHGMDLGLLMFVPVPVSAPWISWASQLIAVQVFFSVSNTDASAWAMSTMAMT